MAGKLTSDIDTTGVLALQGGFALHGKMLTQLKKQFIYIKTAEQFSKIKRLIIPGGESTTFFKLLTPKLQTAIIKFHAAGKPIFSTCAGTILLAKLNLCNIIVERNAYGRQIDSFQTVAKFNPGGFNNNDNSLADNNGFETIIPLVFIRAPKITDIGPKVKVLLQHKDDIVLIQDRNVLAATCHPELTDSLTMHQYFMNT